MKVLYVCEFCGAQSELGVVMLYHEDRHRKVAGC